MQLEQAHLEDLVDQRADAQRELPLVRHEREQHARRESAVEHESRAQVHDEHVLEPEQQAVRAAQRDAELRCPQAGVDLLHEQREPRGSALAAALKEPDRADAAHGLDEVTLLPRGSGDLFVPRLAQRRMSEPAPGRIERHGPEAQRRERQAVAAHDDQQHHRHSAVDDGLDGRPS